MQKYITSQEKFWAGSFGNQYVKRNDGLKLQKNRLKLYTEILNGLSNIRSIIEFGSNIGINLKVLKKIFPNADMSAIEINADAVKKLKKIKNIKVYHSSIFDFVPDTKHDLVLISGVLIHINPKMLDKVYDLLYRSTNKYIILAEYYNPTPVSIPYRGHRNKLFKRDFAGEMLDKYKDLRLVKYGFKYHREDVFNGDDTWFLLKKVGVKSKH